MEARGAAVRLAGVTNKEIAHLLCVLDALSAPKMCPKKNRERITRTHTQPNQAESSDKTQRIHDNK